MTHTKKIATLLGLLMSGMLYAKTASVPVSMLNDYPALTNDNASWIDHAFNPENLDDVKLIMTNLPIYHFLATLHEATPDIYRITTDIGQQHQLFQLHQDIEMLIAEQRKTNALLSSVIYKGITG